MGIVHTRRPTTGRNPSRRGTASPAATPAPSTSAPGSHSSTNPPPALGVRQSVHRRSQNIHARPVKRPRLLLHHPLPVPRPGSSATPAPPQHAPNHRPAMSGKLTEEPSFPRWPRQDLRPTPRIPRLSRPVLTCVIPSRATRGARSRICAWNLPVATAASGLIRLRACGAQGVYRRSRPSRAERGTIACPLRSRPPIPRHLCWSHANVPTRHDSRRYLTLVGRSRIDLMPSTGRLPTPTSCFQLLNRTNTMHKGTAARMDPPPSRICHRYSAGQSLIH